MRHDVPYQTMNCFILGPKDLLIVGDCPGRHEARHSHPFVGPSGRSLMRIFSSGSIVPSPKERPEYWRKKRIGFVNVYKGFMPSAGCAADALMSSGLCPSCKVCIKQENRKVENDEASAVIVNHRGPILILGEKAFLALHKHTGLLGPLGELDWKAAVESTGKSDRILVSVHPSPLNRSYSKAGRLECRFTDDLARIKDWLKSWGAAAEAANE